MMDRFEALSELAADYARIQEVEAILLAGSAASGAFDEASDFDVYIYATAPVPLAARQELAARHMSYVELDNRYWEPEDDGILKCGTPIDLVYRDSAWIEEHLKHLLVEGQSSIGFTTCFWGNLLNSRILFDRNGRFASLKERYTLPYPPHLRAGIIQKNRELLKGKLPAYYDQIKKAINRQDRVSINHRIAAFLASYFDILFAINEVVHPGEKRLVALAQANCRNVPKNFQSDIDLLLTLSGTASPDILEALNTLILHLDELIDSQA